MKTKQFSIRDLFWLMLVVALCAACILNYRALLNAEKKADNAAMQIELFRVQDTAVKEQLKEVTEQVANSDDNSIRLSLLSGLGGLGSDSVYDPDQPPENAKISLRLFNGSSHDITVPAEYDGRAMRLLARHNWPLALVPWRAEKKSVEVVRVAPGEQRMCFSIPLSEIFTYVPPQAGAQFSGFLDDIPSQDGVQLERKWRWWWEAHPAPPPTPVHVEGKLMSLAVLWAELEVNHRTLRTEPIIIPIKTGGND